jgi:hypothetical protein
MIAPHAGLVATAALILSACLLYWLTFGQSRPPIGDSDVLDLDAGWSNEAATAPGGAETLNGAASVTESFPPPLDWSQAPRMADAMGAKSNDDVSGAVDVPPIVQPAPVSGEREPADESLSTPTTAPANGVVDQTAATGGAEPITPTQETAAYPTTSAPCFSFTAPPLESSSPVAGDAPAVAARWSPDSSGIATPR